MSDLIFPHAGFSFEKPIVAFSVNNRLLRGWVKQPSPCCAAASVAGAWNALGAMERTHPAALNHRHVVDIYIQLLQEQIDRLKQSFERKLGVGPISLLIDAVATQLAAEALPSSTAPGENTVVVPKKKEKKVSRVAVGRAARAAAQAYVSSLPADALAAPTSPSAVMEESPARRHPLAYLSEIIAAEDAEKPTGQVRQGRRADTCCC